jgi:multidrug transporter EmrE-like cation transporter
MKLSSRSKPCFKRGRPRDLLTASCSIGFVQRRDETAEAAIAALVDRHGAMFLRVCRQVLGDEHEAQDASQVRFLVLARRGGSIGRRESVASWLHGVALRVAARARRPRRRARERRGGERIAHSREKRDTMKNQLAIVVTIGFSMLGVLGDYLLKLASAQKNPLKSPWFLVGFAVYASTAFGWVFVMRHLKLATIGAVYSVSMILLLTAIGSVAFREPLNAYEVTGLVMAIGSLILLTRFA